MYSQFLPGGAGASTEMASEAAAAFMVPTENAVLPVLVAVWPQGPDGGEAVEALLTVPAAVVDRVAACAVEIGNAETTPSPRTANPVMKRLMPGIYLPFVEKTGGTIADAVGARKG